MSSPGASSSGLGGSTPGGTGPVTQPCVFNSIGSMTGAAGKRDLDNARDDDEARDPVEKIMSICIGEGAADKRGGISADAYAEALKKMAEEYRERDSAGECFVHIRNIRVTGT